MSILQKFKNPIIWILGLIFKLILRLLFFRNIANNDFKRLLSYTLELLPNETFFNLINLMLDIFKSKSSEILNFRLFNEAVTHTIPQEQRLDILSRLKYLFLFLTLLNILKRSLFLVKNMILLPFKLGVYSFIFSLFGIRPDYLLSFFEIFKFNLPGWTYQKLVELHISWLNWFKNTLQINSINTEGYNPDSKYSIPKIFSSHKDIPIIEPKIVPEPDTYLYLTKTQWFYISISIVGLLAAYFGYTGGIPFTKGFSWESNSDSDSNNGGDSGTTDKIINREKDLEREGPRRRAAREEFNAPGPNWISKIINKINPLNWFGERTPEPIEGINPAWVNASETERQDRKLYDVYRRMEEPIVKPETQSRWRFLSRWWSSNNETDLIRTEQLNRREGLNPIDRDELRKEYQETKFSSPTHSDPGVVREYNHLFPRPDPMDNSSQSSSPISIRRKPVPELHEPTWSETLRTKARSLWTPDETEKFEALKTEAMEFNRQNRDMDSSLLSSSSKGIAYPSKSSLYSIEDANDSTDTVTPANVWTEVKGNTFNDNVFNDNIPTDVTASELIPLTNPQDEIEETHTYPPRSFGKNRILNYYPDILDSSGSQPFARGFSDEIDPNLININRGSLMFSSSFLDKKDK